MTGTVHVVIGAGEVGQAIAEVLAPHFETHIRDIEDAGPERADVIHICFPYSSGSRFTGQVEDYQRRYQASLVIVHSTVPLGACELILDGVVHSPVRGRHPHLAESVRRFTKYFGGPRANQAAALFEIAGVKTVVCASSRDTEAAKLWELAQYGMAIVVEKAIHTYCEAHGLDFDLVYTDFAITYNEGYVAVGEPQFVRPVLRHVPGPIGGHCVVQNSHLIGHPFGDMIASAGILDRVEVTA